MSGGVDSSVAAALLYHQGLNLIGVNMLLEHEDRCAVGQSDPGAQDNGAADARRVCEFLGIPFQLIDLRDEFRREVIEYFLDSYAAAQTPNPCLLCNSRIKFGALLERVLTMDCQYLATGHYARIGVSDGLYQLRRGVDANKDQSYVLYALDQQQLSALMFPLGIYTKDRVRTMAREMGLPSADRPESQDACFIPAGDYRAFVAQNRPEALLPGPVLDLEGQPIGHHGGLALYTIGQRQKLGISSPEPLYVIRMDSRCNTLIVGPKTATFRSELEAENIHFVSGSAPPQPLEVTAKIRYKAPEAHATLTPLPHGRARVIFDTPQSAITPGQAVVFYQGDVVLGGGIISASSISEGD